MNGLIVLVGAGEYLPVMDDVDRHLLGTLQTDGRAPRVVCLPTAAGQEGPESVGRWSGMGLQHFQALGADVQALPIIDRESADDPQYESILESADLIYFSGGNPLYLYETMNGSRAWNAAQKAWARGAIYAGCSAGAMILAKQIPSFRLGKVSNGFGAVPAKYILPHFDKMPGLFKAGANLLLSGLDKNEFALGIEEDTALVGKPGGEWKVMGRSKVHVLKHGNTQILAAGESVPL